MAKRHPQHDDRWERTPGGLFLRKRPALPTRRFIEPHATRQCCCDECQIPSCWNVTLSGFSDDSCENCDAYNKIWYMPRVGESTVWSCTIPDTCTDCGEKTITLTFDENTNTITLEFNGVSWSKSVTISTSTYCENHTLSYVSNSGDCDYDESSVTVNCGTDANGFCPCPYGCGIPCGEPKGFAEGTSPGVVNILIEGMTNQNCSDCDDYNGLYVCQNFAACYYSCDIDNPCTYHSYFNVRVYLSHAEVWVKAGPYRDVFGGGPGQQWLWYSAALDLDLPVNGLAIEDVTLTKVVFQYTSCYEPSAVKLVSTG